MMADLLLVFALHFQIMPVNIAFYYYCCYVLCVFCLYEQKKNALEKKS